MMSSASTTSSLATACSVATATLRRPFGRTSATSRSRTCRDSRPWCTLPPWPTIGWAFTTGNIKIMSDGSPWRPIVHVEDISMAFAQALVAPAAAVHNQAFNVGAEGENYQVRDLAGIVNELLPEAGVEYVGKNPDPRNYRVSFKKIQAALPGFRPRWNARRGAGQLLHGYRAAGLTTESFQGPSFTRLLRLKALIGSGELDPSLRWRVPVGVA